MCTKHVFYLCISLMLVAAIVQLSACSNKSSPTPPATVEPTSPVAPAQAPQQSTAPAEPIDTMGHGETTQNSSTNFNATPPSDVHAPTPENTEALSLATKSGCMACHRVEQKLVGPAWNDVGARYKNDAGARASLIEKVKKGGKGNWTDVTKGAVMPPYSPRVKDQDIEALIDFILSL